MQVDRNDPSNTIEMLRDLELFANDYEFGLETHPCGCVWMTFWNWEAPLSRPVGFDATTLCVLHATGLL